MALAVVYKDRFQNAPLPEKYGVGSRRPLFPDGPYYLPSRIEVSTFSKFTDREFKKIDAVQIDNTRIEVATKSNTVLVAFLSIVSLVAAIVTAFLIFDLIKASVSVDLIQILRYFVQILALVMVLLASLRAIYIFHSPDHDTA
jgi:hypothetical protein